MPKNIYKQRRDYVGTSQFSMYTIYIYKNILRYKCELHGTEML